MKFDYYLCKNYSLNNMYVKDTENQIYRLMMNGSEWSVKKSNKKIDTNEFYKSKDYSKKVFQKMIQKGGDRYTPSTPINFEENDNLLREAITEYNIRNNRDEIMRNVYLEKNNYKELKKAFITLYTDLTIPLPSIKISLPLFLHDNYIDLHDDIYQGNSPIMIQRKENARVIKIYYKMVIEYIYYYFNNVYVFLYHALQENDLRKQQNQQKPQKSFFSWRKKPIKNIYNEDYVIEMQVIDRGRNIESINNSLPIDDPRRRIIFKINNSEISLNFILEFLKRQVYEKTLEGLLKFKNDIDNKFARDRYYRKKYGNE